MDAFRGRGNALKTNHWQWPMKEEDLKRGSVSDVYAFVDMKGASPFGRPEAVPDVFIVPAMDVCEKLFDPVCREPPWEVFMIAEKDKPTYFEAWEYLACQIEHRPPMAGRSIDLPPLE